MRRCEGYPIDVATGGCFIRRQHAEPGEYTLDTGVELDDLPRFGRLCLSAEAIKAMVVEMGWDLWLPELREQWDRDREELALLRAHNEELVEAVEAMINLPAVHRAVEVAVRRGADKESIGEWIETLERAR